MAKKVFYDQEAREKVLAGAEILYKAVKTTLGPKGRSVIVSKQYGSPTVTKDGVTVAKNIDVQEDEDNLGLKVGAELIKQAANKLNDKAGDGTTTVTVLTYHILKEANKLITAGHNPVLLRKGLELVATEALKVLDSVKEEITDEKRLAEVATISASDAEIGKLIAKVISKVGKDGVVTVEESHGLELQSEVVEGFTFDRGFVSQYLVTDQSRMEAVYSNPVVLITDNKIGSFQEVLPLLEKIINTGKKEVLIIAEDVEGEALANLIVNKLKGIFLCVAVKAPSYGENKKAILEDIATITGGTVISSDVGLTFENAELTHLGSARKVIVTKDETTIIDGHGTTDVVEARVAQIDTQIESTKSEYDKETLQKRKASIEGKVAVIKVGGASETEIEEKKYRVDDAVHAVKASLAEGIVAGGGVTLLHIVRQIRNSLKLKTYKDDTLAGAELLLSALEQPFRELLVNSGMNPDKYIDTLFSSAYGQGVDVTSTEGVVNLVEKGVVDPARVTKEVILNAVSIAGTAMTMGALVVDIPEKEVLQPQMPMM